MSVVKPIYKVVRSIVIAVIMLVAVVYVGLYLLLSLPSVQEQVKTMTCKELSQILDGKLNIGNLNVLPFTEVLLNDVSLDSPDGVEVARIEKVSAGIDLNALIFQQRIVLNYAEIIGLDAKVAQETKDGPLNIQFLIDALSPKDKAKPPTKFDLRFRNIIIRKSKAVFSRPWIKDKDGNPCAMSEVTLNDLRLDLSIPTLKNDLFRFDIRNMQASLRPGITIEGLSANITYSKRDGKTVSDKLTVEDLTVRLPNSLLNIGDISLTEGQDNPIPVILEGYLTPSDFSGIFPTLDALSASWNIDLNAYVSKSSIDIERFYLENESSSSFVSVKGTAGGINKTDSIDLDLKRLNAYFTSDIINIITGSITGIPENAKEIIKKAGDISFDLAGNVSNSNLIEGSGEVITDIGDIKFDGSVRDLKSKRPRVMAKLDARNIELGQLLSTEKLGTSSFSVKFDVTGLDKNADGEVDLISDYIILSGKDFNGLTAFVNKSDNQLHAILTADDDDLEFDMEAECTLDGENTSIDAYVDLNNLNTEILGVSGKFAESKVRFNLDAHTQGSNADNLAGFLHLSDFNVENDEGKTLKLNNLSLNIDYDDSDINDTTIIHNRNINLKSDWGDAKISGQLYPNSIMADIKGIISSIFPSLVPSDGNLKLQNTTHNSFDFDIELKGNPDLYDFLGTPFCPLTEIPVKGCLNGYSGKMELTLASPHIRQGKDKLIRDTSLKMTADSFLGMARIDASTIYPAKKGDVEVAIGIVGIHDKMNVDILLNPTMESSLKGNVAMKATFGKMKNPFSEKDDLSVHVDIIPSAIAIMETVWNISNGKIDYSGKNVSVDNFKIEHENQYVRISGTASENSGDILSVRLNDIDLDYIFGILNINYVTFGGMATGEVLGSQLLTKNPVAHTRYLRVKGLSYNNAVLGDGNLAATYFPKEQKVGIYAVINDPLTREKRANIDGGIWVTRDSLSFTFDANKVNLQLMKPFVSAFSSELYGRGSGKCKLYGTFSDIDLTGKLYADTISMKIDFTNTWYHAGGDSVVMGKGMIEIPPLTLYDSEGHTADLSGWLRHRYFHEPEFGFKIRDAKSILCYDTSEKQNPLWYGTIYASGNGQIAGRHGIVEIDMNMTTDENSKFFYVISDAEDTGSYSFLSFTDKRKEMMESMARDSVPDYLHQFLKNVNNSDNGSSNVVVSLKGSVTNDALLTLVMDPIAGDKITARGQGALQMDYNMAANDLRMIGTYVLDEGNYYFTLQDIIIKNFNIKQGSSIKFDGDPMNAILDIAATYRVNTNLTDLDQSFAQDKELNRTNVPVDAILLVDGPMTHPDIDFDLELPTLTSDVERKVKSIVSTNDMMSRQIIYLLALNRFYTQEYTGGSGNSGAEWSSMASSTISSQLSNILSNITDKLSVSPSFRSDKGDFSDMEFDLALSSRLLNNRLLINGNFGYRDRQTSNTQFVGDFDIEYLLNKNGNLRLKAYNHFNDQNYYLRSALTTQGVGVVFRRDFNHLFNLGKKKIDVKPAEIQETDTVIKEIN